MKLKNQKRVEIYNISIKFLYMDLEKLLI